MHLTDGQTPFWSLVCAGIPCSAEKKHVGLSRTTGKFQYFPGRNSFSTTFQVLKISAKKIQDFPGGKGTLLIAEMDRRDKLCTANPGNYVPVPSYFHGNSAFQSSVPCQHVHSFQVPIVTIPDKHFSFVNFKTLGMKYMGKKQQQH